MTCFPQRKFVHHSRSIQYGYLCRCNEGQEVYQFFLLFIRRETCPHRVLDEKISDQDKVYVFRDVDENEKCRYSYQHCIELGKTGYTLKVLREAEDYFGCLCHTDQQQKERQDDLQQEYKRRWEIETFYQFDKNRADFNNLMLQDYYKEQGFAFIMLVAGQIHQQVINAVKKLDDNTMSVSDVLLMARFMKLELRGSAWTLKNTRKQDLQILKKDGFQAAADDFPV